MKGSKSPRQVREGVIGEAREKATGAPLNSFQEQNQLCQMVLMDSAGQI